MASWDFMGRAKQLQKRKKKKASAKLGRREVGWGGAYLKLRVGGEKGGKGRANCENSKASKINMACFVRKLIIWNFVWSVFEIY